MERLIRALRTVDTHLLTKPPSRPSHPLRESTSIELGTVSWLHSLFSMRIPRMSSHSVPPDPHHHVIAPENSRPPHITTRGPPTAYHLAGTDRQQEMSIIHPKSRSLQQSPQHTSIHELHPEYARRWGVRVLPHGREKKINVTKMVMRDSKGVGGGLCVVLRKMSISITRHAQYPQARFTSCLLYTSPSPRDATLSRMPSSA